MFDILSRYEVNKVQDQTTSEGIRVIYANTCREVCSQQIAVAVKDGTMPIIRMDNCN